MTPSSTRSRPSRGAARLLVWGVAALLGLIGVAWGLLAVLLPPARVRALVQQQVASALAREVRFADVSVALWPPVRLTVERPELAEPGGFARGAAFQARSIHLDLDVLALLGRRVVVRRLVVEQPALHLVLRADGTTNFDGVARPPPAGRPAARPMDLELREVRVAGGRVLVDDLAKARRTTFTVETRVALKTEHSGERVATSGDTRVAGLAWGPVTAGRLADLDHALGKLEWRIRHRGAFDARAKRLALEQLALEMGRTEISLSGIVDDPGPRARLDLRARGSRVELRDVLAHLAAADARALAGIQGSGRLDFDLAVRGALGPGRRPAILGRLSLADGAFRYPGARAGVSRLAFTARFAPDSLVILDLVALVTDPSAAGARAMAPVRGSLAVARFDDPIVSFTVRGDVDLAAVSPLLAAGDTRLSGHAVVALSGRGRARDPGSMALDGAARLSNVGVESPRLPKKIEKVQGEIRFAPAAASVHGLSLTAGQSSLSLDARITRPLALMAKPGSSAPAGVEFALRSPYLDLAELLPVTPGAPILPNASGGGTVAIARLRNQKLDVKDVSARVELAPAALSVSSYALTGYGGAVNGSARFDLADPAKPSFAVKAHVDSVEADALLSAWTPARGWLRGRLNTTLDLSGDGTTPEDLRRTLTAIGLALVSDGTLGPGPALDAVAKAAGLPAFREIRFRDLRLPFHVERGRVLTDPVTIEGGHGRWQIVGGIGFDGTLDYAVSVTLPPEVSAALGARSSLAAGALADANGNLLLDLRVSGPARAPKATLDMRAMRDRLEGRLSQALAEQRRKMEDDLRASLAARQNAAEDSARAASERTKRAAADSLQRKAGDLLRGFFGGGRDTTRR